MRATIFAYVSTYYHRLRVSVFLSQFWLRLANGYGGLNTANTEVSLVGCMIYAS